MDIFGAAMLKFNFHILMQPVYSFEEASMPEYILKEVLKQGFTHRKDRKFLLLILIVAIVCKLLQYVFVASPIQSQGWPMALQGRDMIGISATGSGKTLAFLLPGMIHINAQVNIIAFHYAKAASCD